MSDQAMNAPMAPTAPNARLSTPVVRYSTTIPTPDRLYTPPRARPVTMNGWKSRQEGTQYLPRGLGLADLRDRRVDVGDGEAPLLLDHLPVLRYDRAVRVVGDVQRGGAVVPGLAEDVRLEVLDVPDRLVDARDGEVAGHAHQRLDGDAGLDEAHLAEAAQGDVRRVALLHGPVQLAVGAGGGGEVQLRVDAELAVPLWTERVGQEVGVARRRACPLH